MTIQAQTYSLPIRPESALHHELRGVPDGDLPLIIQSTICEMERRGVPWADILRTVARAPSGVIGHGE